MTALSLDPTGFTGYRRSIRITPAPGAVRAELEEDFHHFVVSVTHGDGIITGLDSEAVRFPWTLCPAAGRFLHERFIGRPLVDPDETEDAFQHCTHQFDLLQLARAHANDPSPTRYDIAVTDAVDDHRQARISRDGEDLLTWDLNGEILRGGPQDGQRLRRLSRWIDELPASLHEAARVLRRGAMIGAGRIVPLDTIPNAGAIMALAGACYVFQPDRAPQANRMVGSTQDFSGRPKALLSDEAG